VRCKQRTNLCLSLRKLTVRTTRAQPNPVVAYRIYEVLNICWVIGRCEAEVIRGAHEIGGGRLERRLHSHHTCDEGSEAFAGLWMACFVV
jgi:hypothetical protein